MLLSMSYREPEGVVFGIFLLLRPRLYASLPGYVQCIWIWGPQATGGETDHQHLTEKNSESQGKTTTHLDLCGPFYRFLKVSSHCPDSLGPPECGYLRQGQEWRRLPN